MGIDLDLYIEDKSINSPYLTRSFKDEIIFEWYIKFSDFLSEEENKIISPNTYGEIILGKKREATLFEKAKIPFLLNKAINGKMSIENINKLRDQLVHRSEKIEDRERDPNQLKEALKKVENHLILNKDKLPLVHFVFETKELKDEINYVMIDGIESEIKGDLFFYENYSNIRNSIHVQSYLDDYGKIDLHIEVKEKIEINNKVYFTKTITKSEQFENEFKKCYVFLNEAIKNNKKVLWEFG